MRPALLGCGLVFPSAPSAKASAPIFTSSSRCSYRDRGDTSSIPLTDPCPKPWWEEALHQTWRTPKLVLEMMLKSKLEGHLPSCCPGHGPAWCSSVSGRGLGDSQSGELQGELPSCSGHWHPCPCLGASLGSRHLRAVALLVPSGKPPAVPPPPSLPPCFPREPLPTAHSKPSHDTNK